MSEATPLDELQWSSPEWIQTFGLNSYNVLEYFAQSPFYDRTSNNQVLKMQFQFNQNLINMPQTHPVFIKNLQKMTGVEFIVHINNEPNFYIIRKQHRINMNKVRILHDYYIINSNIYMSPNIYSILNSRVLNCILSFKKSFNILNDLNNFTPSQGHQYVIHDINNSIADLENQINAINNKDAVINGTGANTNVPGSTPNVSAMRRKDTNTPTSLNMTPNSSSTPGNLTTANNAISSNRQPLAIFDRLLNITMKEIKSKDADFGSEIQDDKPPEKQE